MFQIHDPCFWTWFFSGTSHIYNIIYNKFIFIKQHEIIHGCATLVLGKILISCLNNILLIVSYPEKWVFVLSGGHVYCKLI